MARIFINGLSLGSMSGAYVLFGHLEQVVKAAKGQGELVILLQKGMILPGACQHPNVRIIEAPKMTKHWATRIVWEMRALPGLIKQYKCDKYFTPAGTILPGCRIPQYALAQNPWPMVSHLHRTIMERFKGRLLREAYRKAYNNAAVMIYNSHHMQEMYKHNANAAPGGEWVVAYQGVSEEMFKDAKSKHGTERIPLSILSVSAMAHWKGAEVLVNALKMLRQKDIPAVVTFVGP